MPTIALDFDGTVRDWKTNEPLPGARDAISLLRERGYKILIHSCNQPEFIEQWMNHHDIRYDSIWTGKGKPVADCYLDDNGLQWESWPQALADLGRMFRDGGL